MGLYGVPWLLVGLEVLAGPGMLLIAVIMIKSRWWKNLTEYYFSWNEGTDDKSEETGEREYDA